MMTNPFFSIVTITYNNLNGLQKTAQSVTRQTCQDYQWIIIDGTSTDGTPDYLETLNAEVTSEPDNGIYDAMNKGIARTTGHYVLFLNAGDTLKDSTTLAETYNRAKEQNYDFIYGDSMENLDNQHVFKRSKPHIAISQGMFTHHQSMFYNAALLKNMTYNTAYNIAADYDLTWAFVKKSEKFLYLPFPICIFQSGGVSQQQVLKGRIEQYKIRKKHGATWINRNLIFVKQSIGYVLRLAFPRFYWRLKQI